MESHNRRGNFGSDMYDGNCTILSLNHKADGERELKKGSRLAAERQNAGSGRRLMEPPQRQGSLWRQSLD